MRSTIKIVIAATTTFVTGLLLAYIAFGVQFLIFPLKSSCIHLMLYKMNWYCFSNESQTYDLQIQNVESLKALIAETLSATDNPPRNHTYTIRLTDSQNSIRFVTVDPNSPSTTLAGFSYEHHNKSSSVSFLYLSPILAEHENSELSASRMASSQLVSAFEELAQNLKTESTNNQLTTSPSSAHVFLQTLNYDDLPIVVTKKP